MSVLDTMIKRAQDWDAARPRSSQAAIGWSEVGGCRARLGHRLRGDWPSDQPDTWAAIRGTALHLFLESLMDGEGEITEIETTYRGIPGHTDLLITADGVYDIKTTSLANLTAWKASPKALLPKRQQAHGYAAGLVDAGRLPADCTVGLICVPADGTFADWWLYEEPFDRAVADSGADRLDEVKRRVAAGEYLQRDEPPAWCERFCEFYTLCRGGDETPEDEPISDPEIAAMIEEYGHAAQQASAAEAVKKKLGPQIRAYRGVTEGGWRIFTGKPGDDKTEPDIDAIRFDYLMRGEEMPQRTVPGKAGSLFVRAPKDAS